MTLMMGEDKERWANIKGYEGYEVSTWGRVRSYWKYGGYGGGSRRLMEEPVRLLKPACGKKYGRFTVRLCDGTNRTSKSIHRLVAIAFIPNPQNKSEVDHIDRNPRNDNVKNLRWATKHENCINTCLYKTNTSGVKGVCYDVRGDGWQASCYVNGKRIRKYFKTKEEAIEWRQQMVEEHYDPEYYTEK